MIKEERLAETFKSLVQIDSESKNEAEMARELGYILESMGAEVQTDPAGDLIGGDCGNLIARFKGNVQAPVLLFSAHMDTVAPGKGIRPRLEDGVFTSDGTTVLGADDKSAIAILLECLRALQENDLPHGPIELVFTVAEEMGLLGAKHLDFDRLTAQYGYVLDTTDTEVLVNQAPGANRFEIQVHGKDAHAGTAPEKGINAIHLAAKALAELQIGRIDAETTCNIGVIEGGIAGNIVPKLVKLQGEVRSHDTDKLEAVTEDIRGAFRQVMQTHQAETGEDLPSVDMRVENDFSRTHIPTDHPVVTLALQAAKNLDRSLELKTTGGGADANIFFEKGIMTGVLGTGMRDMHTVRESIALADMTRTARLVLEIIRVHAGAA